MSTRKLIFAALLCGMAILLAFTVQVIMLSRQLLTDPESRFGSVRVWPSDRAFGSVPLVP